MDRKHTRTIRWLIWLYVFMVLFEGAVRKWGPGALNYPLLVARDPIVILIYGLALAKGVFRFNGFIAIIIGIGTISMLTTMTMGHGDYRVALYGVHANFLHIPLIWVIGTVMNRRDIAQLGFAYLLVTIPNTYLMKLQFADPWGWISKGVGSDIGGQLDGGSGKIRPPGLFTFITGNNMFYPLAAAFLLSHFTEPKKHKAIWWIIIAAVGGCIAYAQFISISRTMLLATLIVVLTFACTMVVRGGLFSSRFVILCALTPVVMFVLYNFVPDFKDGIDVFSNRWEASTGEKKGGVEGAIVKRFFGGFTNAIYFSSQTSIFGSGIGMGTNVGARFLTGEVAFLLAEDEWSRLVLEMGPLLGVAYIFVRIAMTVSMLIFSFSQLFKNKNSVPLLLCSAAALPVLQGQLGPSTMLGFTVLGAGLVFAAGNQESTEDEEESMQSDEDEDIRKSRIRREIPKYSS